jgi:hypothetical protein
VSIEFETEISGAGDVLSAIVDALKEDPEVETLSSTEAGVITLRLRTNPPREKWPEDVALTVEPKHLYVAFHSATRQQREHLVTLLEQAISRAGCSGKLVEE